MRIDEGKLPRLTSIKAAGDHAVTLRFESGKTFTVDLRELIQHSKGLKKEKGTRSRGGGSPIALP
jgi:hypothetical protein